MSFFQQLEHVLQFGLPIILVVMGSARQLEGLEADIERLSHVSGQIRVITIPLDRDAQ